jgi:two-component system phosphate regulon response regulator PhoB
MILIVEDHEDTGRLLCRLFTDHGYEAHHCIHPRDALQVLEHFRPALLILDMMMPDVSGLDVLRTVRVRPELAEVPVLVHSGSEADGPRRKAEELGISGYVVKRGETASRLLKMVQAVLGPAQHA